MGTFHFVLREHGTELFFHSRQPIASFLRQSQEPTSVELGRLVRLLLLKGHIVASKLNGITVV